MKQAVILLSGGLDSATTGAIARDRGFDLVAMTFNYGQRHDIEVEYSKKLAEYFSALDHFFIDIPSNIFKTALVRGSDIDVPHDRVSVGENDIPETYVPGRNILFLSYALSLAESRDINHIFIGANAVDYSGYPDCRPEFFRAFTEMARQGTKAGIGGNEIVVETPLIDLKKSEIIRIGINLGVDYSLTHSCYDPAADGSSCGSCDSCIIRKQGFDDAGVPDPTRYRNED